MPYALSPEEIVSSDEFHLSRSSYGSYFLPDRYLLLQFSTSFYIRWLSFG